MNTVAEKFEETGPDAFFPCAASSNDHTYTQHCTSQFDEAFIGANLNTNHCVPPSALLLESATAPTDFSSSPSSPRTECWGKLDNGVDIKLRVEEIPGDCTYSVKNKQFHVKAQGKFAVTALLTGISNIYIYFRSLLIL